MRFKEFEKFVWEEELKVLGLEYFYIGKHFVKLRVRVRLQSALSHQTVGA